MSDKMQDKARQSTCQIESQNIYMLDNMSNKMQDRISDRMSECMNVCCQVVTSEDMSD